MSGRAAEQMERDGIRTLPRWTKPVRSGCATYQQPIEQPCCGAPGCAKKARYSVDGVGERCFTHAIEFAGRGVA